ncbi:MAG: (Fe-S)-binding protein [candidate division WOR-3 bacterium]|nr:(Fe-S)-binding protein [candidate division WOR-3 bacterium]
MNNLLKLNPEIRGLLLEQGAEDALKCYECGRCMAACPWNMLEGVNYTTYQFPDLVRLGAILCSEDKETVCKETNEVFRCVGCDSCLYECPRKVNISNILRSARRIMIDFGSYPAELKSLIFRLTSSNNPLGESHDKRKDWVQGLEIEKYNSTIENLLFVCCITAYDPRAKNVARSLAQILKKAGVSFGIASDDESCCGEAIRRAGGEKIFRLLYNNNINAFKKLNVKNAISISPHCYTIFASEYRSHYNFQLYHYTQTIFELIKNNRIKPVRPFNKIVVYHDPCTLGRQSGIYEEPREILKSIPGLRLAEVPFFNRKNSICCGAGSMGLWREYANEERLVNLRLKQLLTTGAEVIAVSCPYCLQMFEETLKAKDTGIRVMDISEILAESMEI